MKSLTVCPPSVLAGVCGVGPVPADPEEAAAEGLQRRLSPLPPNPEHPRLPGREGMYDGPHRVYEPNALHCTTGNTRLGTALVFNWSVLHVIAPFSANI